MALITAIELSVFRAVICVVLTMTIAAYHEDYSDRNLYTPEQTVPKLSTLDPKPRPTTQDHAPTRLLL